MHKTASGILDTAPRVIDSIWWSFHSWIVKNYRRLQIAFVRIHRPEPAGGDKLDSTNRPRFAAIYRRIIASDRQSKNSLFPISVVISTAFLCAGAVGNTTVLRGPARQLFGCDDLAVPCWKRGHGCWVFETSVETPIDPHNVAQRQLHPVLERLELPTFSWHRFRKLQSTYMADQGVGPRVLQAQLGHADAAMTLNIYTEVLPESQRRAVEGLERLLFRNVPKLELESRVQ